MNDIEGIDFVVCRLCQKHFKVISNTHLQNYHDMTVREYIEEFPGVSILSEELRKRRMDKIRGKTYEEIVGVEKATQISEKKSKSLTGRKLSKEQIEKYKKTRRAGDNWFQSEESKRKNSESHNSEEWSRKVLFLWQDPEYREKQRISHTGKSGPLASNWQGGIGSLPYPFEFNKGFTEFIRERYDYTCMLCKLTQERVGHILNVHHIDYDKNNLDLDNFVPLCNSCHGATNGNRTYWIKVLQNTVNMNKTLRVSV